MKSNHKLSISTSAIALVFANFAIPYSSSESLSESESSPESSSATPFSTNSIPPGPFGPRSCSLISRSCGTSPCAFNCLISSGRYFMIMSHLESCYLRLHITRSPTPIHTFFFIFPRMWPNLSTSSKHFTSTLPFPSIFNARPY